MPSTAREWEIFEQTRYSDRFLLHYDDHPQAPRQLWGAYDDEGIFVFQAFCPSIAGDAVRKGYFDRGFRLNRMSWIKPSLGWMLHRSDYGRKENQERILRIKIPHAAFETILRNAALAQFDDSPLSDRSKWKRTVARKPCRIQWDPDRDLEGKKLPWRAIQIGLRGEVLENYAREWILELSDFTPFVRRLLDELDSQGTPTVEFLPAEKQYPLDEKLAAAIGCDVTQ